MYPRLVWTYYVMEDNLELLSTELQASATMSGLCGAGDGAQGFVHKKAIPTALHLQSTFWLFNFDFSIE